MYEQISGWRRHCAPPLLALSLTLSPGLPAMAAGNSPSPLAPGGGRALQSQIETLSLADALALALDNNPGLKIFAPQRLTLEGQRLIADQTPPLVIGIEAENIFGSGNYNDAGAAELTVALSSVVELGGQRKARAEVANRRIEQLNVRQHSETLSFLGEVTRQFVVTLALQNKRELAQEAQQLAAALRDVVRRRTESGASPQAELLRSRAQWQESKLAARQVEALYRSELASLRTLIGMPDQRISHLAGNLLATRPQQDFDRLWAMARDNPQIQLFTQVGHLRDAELALVHSRARGQIEWSLGARYFNDSDDAALLARFSMPLLSAHRNRGDEQAARAAREEVRWQREAALLELRARLYTAWSEFDQARYAVQILSEEVIPTLREALSQTAAGYEHGAYSYVDWQSARRELLDAKSRLIDAATNALLSQSFIEQLSGQSLAAPAVTAATAPTEKENSQ
ncbi:MAG: TolC family protein [Parahaliea sp.]